MQAFSFNSSFKRLDFPINRFFPWICKSGYVHIIWFGSFIMFKRATARETTTSYPSASSEFCGLLLALG
jgi:hypothetical protein